MKALDNLIMRSINLFNLIVAVALLQFYSPIGWGLTKHTPAAAVPTSAAKNAKHISSVKAIAISTRKANPQRHNAGRAADVKRAASASRGKQKHSYHPKNFRHSPHVKETRQARVSAAAVDAKVKEPTAVPGTYRDLSKAYDFYDQALNARLAGDYDAALHNASQALDLLGGNESTTLRINVEYELARAAEGKGDLALARRYYARSLTDEPKFVSCAIALAKLLQRQGELSTALQVAKDAVAHNENDARTHILLAILLEKTGFVKESQAERLKAAQLSPQSTIGGNADPIYSLP